ncbi:MAG: chemotaxis protein CheB [Thermodesulfobacteriota bacterium]
MAGHNIGLPILVVHHLHPGDNGNFAEHIDLEVKLSVVTPCDKQKINRGFVYIASANYHMLVERNGIIALSTEGRVNWSRPSIDVLFESVAHAWKEEVSAILPRCGRSGKILEPEEIGRRLIELAINDRT